MTDELTPIAANHIHADYWDVVSPLRIAQLRIADGRPLRIQDGAYNIEANSTAHEMLTELENRAANQGDQDALHLDKADTMLLSVCLQEAIRTAYDDRMPRCAERMTELLHEVDSGRSPMILVLGRCLVCWPDSRLIQTPRHLETIEEEASLAAMHADNPHTAIFNALSEGD